MPARNFQMQPSGHPSRKPAPSAQRTSEGNGSFAGTVNGGSEPFHDICGDPAARNREGRPSSLHCVGDVLAHAPRQLSGCIAFAAPIVRDLAEISPSRMIECHSI